MLPSTQIPAFLSGRRIVVVAGCLVLFVLLYETSYFIDTTPSHAFEESKATLSLPPSPDLNDGNFHWQDVKIHYPVISLIPLPTGQVSPVPRIQHAFGRESQAAKTTRVERQAAVKEAFEHAWSGYRSRAWMADEVAPLSGGSNNFFGGWAASLVDALDTLWIMEMGDEFAEAVAAIETIDFTTTDETTLNLFETTIRYMGGFLGAYDLSGGTYPTLLRKAMELGEMLLVAFDTPNHMPITRWEWKRSKNGERTEASANTLVAEIGSLTLEFTRLSQLTGDMRYYDAVQRITNHFDEQQMTTKLPGMWPVLVNARDLKFGEDTGYTLGAMADSLFEYFPKEHMLLGGQSQQYRKLYERAAEVFSKYNFYRPMVKDEADILFSGGVRADGSGATPVLDTSEQHLVCYAGGMVAIAARIFDRPEDLATARKLTDGCIWAYDSMPNGLMAEVAHFTPCASKGGRCPWEEEKWHSSVMAYESDSDRASGLSYAERVDIRIKNERLPPGYSHIDDRRYILRPEAIESVFVLYRITGDMKYQDAAWRMFQAIEKHTRTEIANAALDDITASPPTKSDRMESFWMAETLKYFYLVFAEPDLVSLDHYVLNTEAHPLKRS
ncbi:hypothetical protein AAFC00_006228 [Neodothiora populina]|uniref:alpha-1,2-Mannosidase n=1 Tax=Neodothiora populina TaxID=2781224 RepID=A0ABR3P4H6_9PEZI